MAKFIALDMENADDGVWLNLVLFEIKAGLPKKGDELQLLIKTEKRFNDSVLEMMSLFCELDGEAMDKFTSLIENASIVLIDGFSLTNVAALYCGFMNNPVIVNVSEMARCLNFDMEQGENKCEVIMNSFVSIWKKQTFVCAPYA